MLELIDNCPRLENLVKHVLQRAIVSSSSKTVKASTEETTCSAFFSSSLCTVLYQRGLQSDIIILAHSMLHFLSKFIGHKFLIGIIYNNIKIHIVRLMSYWPIHVLLSKQAW